MSERWAPLDGWVPDQERPGYLRHPDHHVGWRRDLAGHWYSVAFIDAARAAVEEAAKQGDLNAEFELVERVRRAAREVLGDG